MYKQVDINNLGFGTAFVTENVDGYLNKKTQQNVLNKITEYVSSLLRIWIHELLKIL